MLRHHLPRGGHEQGDPRGRLGEKSLQRGFDPALDGPHQKVVPAAARTLRRSSATFTSAPATATISSPDCPGARRRIPSVPPSISSTGSGCPSTAVTPRSHAHTSEL